MKSRLIVAITFMAVLLLLVACGSSASETTEDEHMDDDHTHDMDEDMAAAHGVPAEAAVVPNPISFSDDSIAAGESIFVTNCVACHGEKGLGDGPAAAGLEKPPANLTESHVQMLSDGALFFIVTNGKEDTPMPAWENTLSEDDRWNVVNFLRTLADGNEDDHDDDHMHEEEHVEDEHMEGDEHEAADHEHEEGDEHSDAEHEHDDADEHEDGEHKEDEHEDGDDHEEDDHTD